MVNSLLLKTNEAPTYFNKEAVIGTLLVPVVGTVVGAWLGKRRMERESTEGKIVTDTPTPWNKDALLGGLVGATAAAIIGIAGPVGAVIFLASTAVGAYFGGKNGEKTQEREYQEARQQVIVQNISSSVSPEVGQAVQYAMSHDKNWGKEVTEKRLLEQVQQRQV